MINWYLILLFVNDVYNLLIIALNFIRGCQYQNAFSTPTSRPLKKQKKK